jgi:hypothetical protein
MCWQMERIVKKKWKIIKSVIVIIVVLYAAILFLLSFFSMDKSMAPPPSESPVVSPTTPNSVDRLLDNMEFGAIAFNAPASINIKNSQQIQLLLSLAETVEDLKQSIVKEGEKVGATIRVSDRMEARLTGYKFEITAITPEIQAVSKSQETEWRWEIFPKTEGKHNLHLTLTALLEIDGQSTPRAIKTFDKKIIVTITKTQKFVTFFKNNWQWLWAAIFVPVVGWLWKRKKTANRTN